MLDVGRRYRCVSDIDPALNDAAVLAATVALSLRGPTLDVRI